MQTSAGRPLPDGRKHGRGEFFYSDGGRYEGSWENGKRCGQGIMVHADGEVLDSKQCRMERCARGIELHQIERACSSYDTASDRRLHEATLCSNVIFNNKNTLIREARALILCVYIARNAAKESRPSILRYPSSLTSPLSFSSPLERIKDVVLHTKAFRRCVSTANTLEPLQ